MRLWPGMEADADELRARVAEQIAPFKVPSQIWFVTDPFPRNAAGKMLKRELKDRFAPASGAR